MSDEQKKVPKLDIFRVLNAANNKDVDFYGRLTDDEKKALVPFLVTRWMSGTFNAQQVFLINELLNPFTFSLTNHKELLWYLITITNSGKSQKYVWNKLPGKNTSSRPTSTKAIMEYFKYSTKDAQSALMILTKDDVVDIAEDLGYQPEDISKIKREFKDTTPAPKKTDNPKAINPMNELLSF